MGIIRNALRGLVDRELGVLGEQLDKVESRFQDTALQLASLQDRYDRFANRVRMRQTRAAASEGGGGPRDEFARLLAAQVKPGTDEMDEGDGWTDFSRYQR